MPLVDENSDRGDQNQAPSLVLRYVFSEASTQFSNLDSAKTSAMISAKDLPLLLMIVGGFVVVFALICLPGIVTNDSLSHQLGTGDEMMFDRNGGIKKSFWSWDSMVKPSGRSAYTPKPIDEGDLQANPFAE